MANAFDRFDTETETRPKAGNPFDAFDEDAAVEPTVQPESAPVPSLNMGRGAVERGGDLLGGLFTAANAMAERGEEKYPLGGLVWEDGIIPDYMGPDEYSAWRSEKGGDEPLKTAADRWKNLDVGYVENHTWDRVKQEFSEGGALSGSAWAEVMAYGAEQGVKSIPDMVAAMAVLPTYVMARSGEIGEERARNKGKEEADLTDVLEAAPAALGSAILERIGAKGITEAGAEAIGKEALQQGIGKLAKEGVKAGSKEAATEFVQEGIIEYLGEKFGTDAAMSVWEALDRGAAGAVAGGVYGTGAGLGGAAVNQARGRKQETETPVEEPAPPVVQDEVQDEPLASTDDKAPVNDYYGRPDWANDQTNIFRDGTQPETTVAGNPFDVFDQEAPAQAEATPEPAAPATAKQPETSLSESGTGVFRVPVDQINVDPQQYQFRSRVNDQGVDKRLDGIKTWDDKRAGNVLLHRRKDGSLYVADGHHRVDLAKRLGQTELNARVVDEADGVDVATARVEAAMNNIADGKAEPIDVAKVFRDSEVPTGEVRETFNLPNSQVVRDGESLSKLSDNVFGMVAAGQMTEKDGAAIGSAFAEQAQQEAAADAFQKVQPDTEYQRQLLVNEIRAAEFAESQGDQGGLFGDDPQEVSLMQDRLKVLDALRQKLNSDKRLFKSLNDNADRAGEAGNQIATEANATISERSARSLDLIGRVTTTPALNDMVNRAARRVFDGENRASVVKDLKQELLNYETGTAEQSGQRSGDAPRIGADVEPGQESRTGQRVPEQDTAGADQSGQPESQQDEVTPALDLETQTEEQLAAQARARQESQQAEADQRRQEEQRAQADEQVDGFTLTGSDRTADVAMAAGQDDMFVSTPASRKVEQAGTETDTNPTDGQKEAGNYRKGRVRIQGLDIAIENPKGSTRSGTDPDGNRWESTMAHHYGDIKGTKAADGDNLDVFIGPYPEIDQVFVIDQPNADGSFDEHKILLGYANEKEAREGYLANYEKGWKVGPITRMSMVEFKTWVREGDTTKPLATESPQPGLKDELGQKAASDQESLAEVFRQLGRENPGLEYGALGYRNNGMMKRIKEATGREIYSPELKRIFPQEQREAAYSEGQAEALQEQETKATTKQAQPEREVETEFSRQGEFRRTPEYQPDSLTVEQAESIRDELMIGWKGAPDVIVRDQIDQFPPGLQAAIRMAGAESDMRGVFWNDTVYILASRIPDRMRMEQVILHEVIGHYGLRKMLGKDMDRVLNQIWMAHGGQKRAEFIIKRYFPGNSFDVNNKEHRHTVAEELIAHLAEQGRGQTLVQRAVAIIREGLRKLGFTIEFTVDDIVNLLRKARATVENGGFETEGAPGAEVVAASRSEQKDGSGDADIPPNFRFSRAGVPDLDPQPFGPPSDTLIRRLVSKIADKHTVLKGVQKNIQEKFGEISEPANAYRAEELFHGKVENDIRLIEENMVEPLAKAMSDNDVSLKQLDEFLYALHAPERNRVIAERNPEIPEGGSGMTDAEAAEIINKVEKSGKLKEYRALAKRVHDMLAMRRKILKSAGLLDEETVGAWEASYKNYVPLKGWASDEQQSDMPRIGKGFAIAGKESQMAAGRKSKAASPLANTISDLSEAVLRRRKNEVGNAFMNLVEAYPNDNYWRVYTDENPEVERKAVKVKDPATGKMKVEVREQTVPMAMMSDRYFTTKRDGKTFYIKIEDERLMNAMRNIGPDNSNLLVRSLAAVTRVMSSLNTSYNPEFVVSNFSRDIQTALLNLTSEQSSEDGKARGKKIVAKVLKDTGTAIRAINASLKGKPLTGKAGKWQQYFDEFRKDGAKTGWFDMKDIDGQMKDLERMISLAGGSPVSARGLRRGFKAVTEWVENTNSAIENGVRLSAYVNAIEAGIPRSQAASLAKNMTVNFNRKGELGTTMNALYMFANASIQGTANFVRTLGRLNGVKGDPMWQRMHTAQKIAAGMAVGGFMLSVLNRLVAGEDDDEVNWWDKVPDYVKERNIVLMKSLVGGEPGEYWTIPLPYGYNIFPVMGTQLEHVLFSESQSAGDAASNVILAALGSFSPIGFEQSEEAYGLIAKNIMPTILRPVASISLNENFMGGPIFKENFPFGTQKPDSALYFRSTPEAFKALAEGLNDATGGSEFRSGAVDLSPDVMQFLVGYYGGGAYNFFTSRTPNLVNKLVTGVELEDREIPFWRKINGKVLPYEDQSKFYDRRNEIQQLADERKALKGRERIRFMKDYRDKLRLEPIMEVTERRLKALREQRDQIELMDLSAAEADKRLQRIEKQMKRAIDKFNQRYNEADD